MGRFMSIANKKKKEDRKRAKIFSKLTRKITVAARDGGGDPEMNNELSMAIEKAKDNNMPNENIERAIKRGTGELEGANYEKFVYEGYGPGGVALYMDIMSDNRNRTASEIRHLLDKNGGNLGEQGCVGWMFERKGQILIDIEENETDEDEVMMAALEAGAEDIVVDDNMATIYTAPGDMQSTRENIEKENFNVSSSDLAMIPSNEVELDKNDAKKLLKLMDELEDHDDVQEVYSNFDIPDEIMEEISEE